jgi:hypothetical protein
MLSEQPVHVFPFSDPTKRVYCGNWFEGDGWTVLPEQVTCVDCLKRAVTVAIGAGAETLEPVAYRDERPSW